ncbi:MAG: hypothetical protein K9L73_03800 [Spirochaetia bacterium]|nr:hypothetical protein [Spirochaetia bacterium]
MIDRSELEVFLPAYLSPENEKSLLENLRDFPDNIDNRFYEFIGKQEHILYQGDGINGLLYVDIPSLDKAITSSLILSNTCDMDLANERMLSSSVLYTPIIKIEKYRESLYREGFTEAQVKSHMSDIKKQRVTQLFYLPEGPEIDESIVYFDKICHCNSSYIDRDQLKTIRFLSLSQYGFYLLLYKISIHFTRLHEGVDRLHSVS